MNKNYELFEYKMMEKIRRGFYLSTIESLISETKLSDNNSRLGLYLFILSHDYLPYSDMTLDLLKEQATKHDRYWEYEQYMDIQKEKEMPIKFLSDFEYSVDTFDLDQPIYYQSTSRDWYEEISFRTKKTNNHYVIPQGMYGDYCPTVNLLDPRIYTHAIQQGSTLYWFKFNKEHLEYDSELVKNFPKLNTKSPRLMLINGELVEIPKK